MARIPKPSGLEPKGQKLSNRRTSVRAPRQRFLIVCEGERTEPNYFDSFRVSQKVEAVVAGQGYNTLRLVQSALQLSAEDDYDQVWCVFDRDEFPVSHFNRALELASSEGIKVAYSNQAFEVWYLLHFDYFNTATTRKRYIEILGDRLGIKYRKNDNGMFRRLLHLQQTAIDNARKLHMFYGDNHVPARDDPCTTVYCLVEELNRNSP